MVNFERVREPLALFCKHDDSRCTNPAGTLNFKRRHDSSLSRSALILSPVYLLIFTSALLAVGLTVVFVGKRRQEQAVGKFSDQLWRLTSASSAAPTCTAASSSSSVWWRPCIMRCWCTVNGFCLRIRGSWLFWG